MTVPVPAPKYKFGQVVAYHTPGAAQDCPAIICNIHADGVTCDLHVFGWGRSLWNMLPGVICVEGVGPGQFSVT